MTIQEVNNRLKDVIDAISRLKEAGKQLSVNRTDVSADEMQQHVEWSESVTKAEIELPEHITKLDATKLNKREYLEGARKVASVLATILEILGALQLSKEKSALKEEIVRLITFGKVALKCQEPIYLQQFDTSKKCLLDILGEAVMAIRSKLHAFDSQEKEKVNLPALQVPAHSAAGRKAPARNTVAIRRPAAHNGVITAMNLDPCGSLPRQKSPRGRCTEGCFNRENSERRAVTMTGRIKTDGGLELTTPRTHREWKCMKNGAEELLALLEKDYKFKVKDKKKEFLTEELQRKMQDIMFRYANSYVQQEIPAKKSDGKLRRKVSRKARRERLKNKQQKADSPRAAVSQGNADEQLQAVVALENYAEWRKIHISENKTLNHAESYDSILEAHSKVGSKGAPGELKNLMEEANGLALDFIITANEATLKLDTPSDNLSEAAGKYIKALQKTLTLAIVLAHHQKIGQGPLDQIMGALDATNSLATKGEVERMYLTIASSLEAKMIESKLCERVFYLSTSVRAFARQIYSGISHLTSNTKSVGSYLALASTIASAGEKITTLLTFVETSRFFALNKEKLTNEQQSKSMEALMSNRDSVSDLHIWSDVDVTDKEVLLGEDGTLMAASLNKLVTMLTSVENYDLNFTRAFLTTYQSFTTPWVLFTKLKERYTVPASVEKAVGQNIKLRVSIVLKYWVEKQFFDFDDDLVEHIFEFVDKTFPNDGLEKLAMQLSRELKKKIEDRTQANTSLFKPPSSLKTEPKHILSFFASLSEVEVAKQLTLIDHELFCRIEMAGLLNQSWNNDKLKYRAYSILDMIHRANKVSFWVSSMILWQDKAKDRKKTVEKFIDIAENLRKLKNFNTLMGIIAGLSQASVRRLKAVKSDLGKTHKSTFGKLEELMRPSASFKNYREYLHGQELPCVPYLGTYLKDITFIEDGNPDMIDGLINYSKRELVNKVIEEVQHYQGTRYDIEKKEHEYAFLSELPSMTDKQLFDLSLLREPRQ
eukprot:TRINITY_DN1859_c0_g1_i1.p1 TRINITY_DN1859_c0_g1~~TRINITY_DN1859_c0_g1_i1.p1  ORF type:complete len:1124 (-),score=199.38 TRINITY_DN1859_c0_g1_i1:97-3090(-)